VAPSPTPTPSPAAHDDVDGNGSINGPHGGLAHFQLNVKLQAGTKKPVITGYVTYSDPRSGVSFSSSTITSLVISGNHAHITGTIGAGRKKTTFVIDATDNGFPGNNDLFSIQLGSGYSASGNVVSGDIFIN
jgi:hypothetical protein